MNTMDSKEIQDAIYKAFEEVNSYYELKTFITAELIKAINEEKP